MYLNHPDKYQMSHIFLCGFSSGGTLALVASNLFPKNTFKSLIGFYPSSSMTGDPGERVAPVIGRKISSFWTRIFREAYIGVIDARDPRISPTFADATRFPKGMLFTAGHDVSATGMEKMADQPSAVHLNLNILRIRQFRVFKHRL